MDVQLVQKGLDFSRRRKKWLLLLAAFGFTSYGVYKVYQLPSVVEKRRRLLKLLGALVSISELVSDSAETIGVVSKDLKEFLQSDTDEIPTSLKQISKIARSEEFSDSLIGVTQALAVGILRGYRSDANIDDKSQTSSGFADRIMDKLCSTAGSGFASVVVGSFAKNLVMAFYSENQSSRGPHPAELKSVSHLELDSPSVPKWVNVVCSNKCKDLIADCIKLFVSTAVAVYLERTMDVNTYDELFSGMTNPKHETKVRDILVSICNGAMETLVKTSHKVLTSSSSNSNLSATSSSPAVNQSEYLSTVTEEGKFKLRNSFDGIKDSGWVSKVSSTLAVPSNRKFVLDVTRTITFESVRSFLDFLLWKLHDSSRRSLNVVREEVVEILRYISVKSAFIVAVCFALCLHVLGVSRVCVVSLNH